MTPIEESAIEINNAQAKVSFFIVFSSGYCQKTPLGFRDLGLGSVSI